MKNRTETFAICIQNTEADDLCLRKLYEIVPDDKAVVAGYLRIIDDSGEDYLYPASCFILIELPESVTTALANVPAGANL